MKKIVLTLIFLLSSFGTMIAQSGFSNSQEELLQSSMDNKLSGQELLQSKQMPTGNIVNPNNYVLGPGDILSIQAAPTFKTDIMIEVSSDNNVLIPRYGSHSVENKTLAEFTKEVKALISARNPNVDVSITLKRARVCLVTLSGNVTYPATYTIPASYQVSTAISYANNQSIEQMPSSVSGTYIRFMEDRREQTRLYSGSGVAGISSFASRNVKVLHKDGSSSLADLEKATALNDQNYDPYIREGDIIIVPYSLEAYPQVSISGAVIRPIVVPFKKGDKASMLLRFGYGLLDNADLGNTYLYLSDGTKKQLSIDTNLNLIGEDYVLESGSNIIVGYKDKEINKGFGVVAVRGEVQNPGTYLVTEQKSRLKDVIKMAGGFTEKAYLPISYIIRGDEQNSTPTNPRRRINEYFRNSPLVLEDTTRFYADIIEKMPFVSVDFNACFNNNSEKDNVSLEDGDLIVISSNPGKVYVFGKVNRPGYIDFVEGKSLAWYIEQAGGYGIGADKKRASIIRANTKSWITGDEERIVYAGDEVYVPSPPSYPPSVEQARYSLYISILNALITLISITISILR
jgi:protein involved in polysaccharide export with SLBB domain